MCFKETILIECFLYSHLETLNSFKTLQNINNTEYNTTVDVHFVGFRSVLCRTCVLHMWHNMQRSCNCIYCTKILKAVAFVALCSTHVGLIIWFNFNVGYDRQVSEQRRAASGLLCIRLWRCRPVRMSINRFTPTLKPPGWVNIVVDLCMCLIKVYRYMSLGHKSRSSTLHVSETGPMSENTKMHEHKEYSMFIWSPASNWLEKITTFSAFRRSLWLRLKMIIVV